MFHHLVVAMLGGALVSAAPLAASAQTIALNAEIEGKLTRPDAPCPGDAFRCGEAAIADLGPAEWRFFLMSFAPVSQSCGAYTAIVTFTLGDGSTLALEEAGTVCGPGKSFFATPGFSWGNPDRTAATWQVQSGTGQFATITGGTGGSALRSVGAVLRGTYAGILEG